MSESSSTRSEVIPPDFTTSYDLPDLSIPAHGRHIFVFLDGTWNEERALHGPATPTNVLRMFQELKHRTSHEIASSGTGEEPEIVARYYRGVGSRQDNGAAERVWFGFNGKDEQRIRSAAFAGVYCDYRSTNDSIYIIGFSRGAASARLLARNLCTEGLPGRLKVHTRHFPNLLTGQIEARVERVDRLDEGTIHYPKIAFLGCWDTVDAFVLPSRFPKEGWRSRLMDGLVRKAKCLAPRLLGKERFHHDEREIPKSVKTAVHCVAIDETRNAFLPTLMPCAENVEEVWFPGVHADVGGGYDDSMLAVGPYEFMRTRLVQATGLDESVVFKTGGRHSSPAEFCFHFHGLNTGLKHAKDALGFGTATRRIHVLGSSHAKPKIHSSLYSIMGSNAVFAADKRNRRTWTITYDPYNVRELQEEFEPISG